MNRKSLPVSGHDMQANGLPSVIERIRHARHILPARAGDGVKGTHLPANSDTGSTKAVDMKTTASTVYPMDNLHLNQLLRSVRSCTRDRYLKEREVVTIIGRSKAAMHKDVSLGLFPSPIKTGIKSSAWRESEVMGWVEATTILSRVANPGFGMKDFVAALSSAINVSMEVNA